MGSCASLATEEGLVRPAELLSAAFDKVLQDGAENYGEWMSLQILLLLGGVWLISTHNRIHSVTQFLP